MVLNSTLIREHAKNQVKTISRAAKSFDMGGSVLCYCCIRSMQGPLERALLSTGLVRANNVSFYFEIKIFLSCHLSLLSSLTLCFFKTIRKKMPKHVIIFGFYRYIIGF